MTLVPLDLVRENPVIRPKLIVLYVVRSCLMFLHILCNTRAGSRNVEMSSEEEKQHHFSVT